MSDESVVDDAVDTEVPPYVPSVWLVSLLNQLKVMIAEKDWV